MVPVAIEMKAICSRLLVLRKCAPHSAEGLRRQVQSGAPNVDLFIAENKICRRGKPMGWTGHFAGLSVGIEAEINPPAQAAYLLELASASSSSGCTHSGEASGRCKHNSRVFASSRQNGSISIPLG